MEFKPKTNGRATVVAVEFDGCLVTDRYPNTGQSNDALFRELIKFRENGGNVILWTCRDGKPLETAVRYCEALGLKFDAVNKNLPERIAALGSDPRKVRADYYIDDSAILVEWKGSRYHIKLGNAAENIPVNPSKTCDIL